MCWAQLGLTYPKAAKFQTWQKYFMSEISILLFSSYEWRMLAQMKPGHFCKNPGFGSGIPECQMFYLNNICTMYIADNEHPGHVIQSQPPRRLCETWFHYSDNWYSSESCLGLLAKCKNYTSKLITYVNH